MTKFGISARECKSLFHAWDLTVLAYHLSFQEETAHRDRLLPRQLPFFQIKKYDTQFLKKIRICIIRKQDQYKNRIQKYLKQKADTWRKIQKIHSSKKSQYVQRRFRSAPTRLGRRFRNQGVLRDEAGGRRGREGSLLRARRNRKQVGCGFFCSISS